MSIYADIDKVKLNDNGSGSLILGRVKGNDRQSRLDFDESPKGVAALAGKRVWGGDSLLMLGDNSIAQRVTKSLIRFVPARDFDVAIEEFDKTKKNVQS